MLIAMVIFVDVDFMTIAVCSGEYVAYMKKI